MLDSAQISDTPWLSAEVSLKWDGKQSFLASSPSKVNTPTETLINDASQRSKSQCETIAVGEGDTEKMELCNFCQGTNNYSELLHVTTFSL